MDGETDVFASYKEAEGFVKHLEEQSCSSFAKLHMRNHGMERLTSLDGHRIWYEDTRGIVPITYDGVPFVSIQSEVRQCHQGRGRNIKPKENKNDHFYETGRKQIQNTKKVDCETKIRMRMVVRFPDYKIEGQGSEWRRRTMAKRLKDNFSPHVRQEFQVHLRVQGAHEGHLVGELSGYGLPLHKDVKQQISDLVDDGITNAGEIERHLALNTASDVPLTNRRFRPNVGDIRNHDSLALRRKCFSQDDQQNLVAEINKWQEDLPDNQFFFRPSCDNGEEGEQSFLFVHQTKFQQDLLVRYGAEMVVIDSTYQTTKYDIPLFILCVSTNSGYSPVGQFLVLKETTQSIAEALQILQKWNTKWSPKSFMCDFDKAEISALETVFAGVDVFVCNFHREQSWQRWLNRSENGAAEHRQSILKQLHKIAHASSEEEYETEVQHLKSSDFFKQSSAFRNYIEKQWLQERNRWVYCFRSGTTNIQVTTTNGVEALNKKLKYRYLKNFNSGGTLVGLVKVLVERFVLDCKNLYIRNQVVSLPFFKKYSKDVPTFLVGKPKRFVLHCLKRLPSPKLIEDVEKVGDSFVIKSSSGEINVNFTNHLPSCTCEDWKKSHWPCKHLLAIFEKYPEYNWQSLSTQYRALPWFNADETVFKTDQDQQKTPVGNCSIAEKDCITQQESSDRKDEQQNRTNDSSTNEYEKKNNLRKLRYSCLSILKSIESNLYCVNEEETMRDFNQVLKETEELLSKKIPKVRGLPLRSKKVKRRNSLLKRFCPKKKKPVAKKNSSVQKKEKIGDEILDLDKRSEALIPQFTEWNFTEEDEQEVDRIWMGRSSGNVVGNIGPYTLTERSFEFIQSTLSDEVIDAFLHELVRQKDNILHINCITMTGIFNGQSHIHGLLSRHNLMKFDFIIGAHNEGGNHWTLLIIKPHCSEIVYCNPLGTLFHLEQQLQFNWYSVLKCRYDVGLEDQISSAWSIITPPHSRQIDGTSCGIYVLKFAENYLAGKTLNILWTPGDLYVVRKNLALFLMSTLRILRSGVEQTTDAECDTDLECVEIVPSPVPSPVFRRSNRAPQPKRKRSSFIYQMPEKKVLSKKQKLDIPEELYCVCHKPNDGRKYWQCEKCLDWFHPACVGLDENLEPSQYFCKTCQDKHILKQSDPSEALKTGKLHEKPTKKIDIKALSQTWEKMSMHLEDIVRCCDEKCSETDHARHHQFLQTPLRYIDDKRKLFFYGEDVFERKAIDWVGKSVTQLITYDLHPTKPATSARIITLEAVPKSSRLYQLFQTYGIAFQYCLYVLVKEALLYFLCTEKLLPYEHAEEVCQKTERTRHQILGR